MPVPDELCARAMRECACEGVRKASRGVTQLYDHALSPTGIRATQLPILVAMRMAGPLPLKELAGRLGLDRTTLTRNLKGLESAGLVRHAGGEDRRVRLAAVTRAGEEALENALHVWAEVQSRVVRKFGVRRLRALQRELAALGEVVRAGRGQTTGRSRATSPARGAEVGANESSFGTRPTGAA
ncbi:MAG: MarR family winged helix-turn-helix transcriptional regulator, partial [Gaiellales bacterium]